MGPALVALGVLLFLLVLFLISAIKVAREYERGIVFRLGRLFPEPKGPGLFLLIPVGAALGLISATLVWKFTSSASQPLQSGAPGLLGEEGEVREAIGPDGGRVLVHGELWSAHAPAPIPEGARVRVVGVRGLTVEVVPVEHQLKEVT